MEIVTFMAGEAGPAALWFAAFAVALAFFLRGFAGFGASLLSVSALSLIWPPVEVVPVIFLLEVLASAVLLPGAFAHVNWRALFWMFAGMVVATPLGLALLMALPAAAMVLVIQAGVACAALALLAGIGPKQAPGKAATVATGLAVGGLNGAAAIGGPPAVLFFFSVPGREEMARASLIGFFLGTDLVAAGFAAWNGLYGSLEAWRFAFLAPVMVAAAFAGAHVFTRVDKALVRKVALIGLCLLALVGLMRGLMT